MERICELTIREYREKIKNDNTLQDLMHQYLVAACEQKNNDYGLNLKTACYAITFVLNGQSAFEDGLKEKIRDSITEKKLDATFLTGNYVQVAEKYWNAVDKNKNYNNLLFGDLVTNEGRKGSQATHTGKATSHLMERYINDDIAGYTINDLFIEIDSKISESALISKQRKEQMNRELMYARNLIKTFDSKELELQRINKEFDEENRIRKEYVGSEKEQLILSRRGQGKFRAGVLEINSKCPFTLIEENDLLIASHIKPWKNSDDKEKIDPNNGFMFTPTYDKLFDKGLISFQDDGTLIVSKELSEKVINILDIHPGEVLKEIKITHACKRFLSYHRKIVFRDKTL